MNERSKVIGLFFVLTSFLFRFDAVVAYESVEISGGGVLVGKVTFTGTPPKMENFKVPRNQNHCGDSKENETLLIDPQGGIKNVVVTIEGIEKGKSFELRDYFLDNADCQFVPHVQVVPLGQTLQILNSDPILHNIHANMDGSTVFNLAMPLKDQMVAKRMKSPGVLSFKCEAGHTWMSAYVVVVENPYYAVTDESGYFEVDDIPPGTYRVKAWHEELGTEIQQIVIQRGEKAELSFLKLAK